MNVPLALQIIRLIAAGEAHTLDELAAAAATSNATVRRVIAGCNSQLDMYIAWEHFCGAAGGQGRYIIQDWGVIAPDYFATPLPFSQVRAPAYPR